MCQYILYCKIYPILCINVIIFLYMYTWSDNKVRELATVCLPWQHWKKALVWFDDVDISAFHSCFVVDLWQSLSEWEPQPPGTSRACPGL